MRLAQLLTLPVVSAAARIGFGFTLIATLLCAIPGCRCESGPPRGTLGTITLSAAPAQPTTDGGNAVHRTDGGAPASDGGTLQLPATTP